MKLKLASDDGSLTVTVKNVESVQLFDEKTKLPMGVAFVADGDNLLFSDASVIKKPANLKEIEAVRDYLTKLAEQYIAAEAAAKAAAEAKNTPPAAGTAGEPEPPVTPPQAPTTYAEPEP